ncbi:hypothetical protein EVAR_25361_1 [Eumeta japonica]|uniref:Uncharacterized protein n=1 Tax=Eumeta variegata TaxID=151549 RepID=A0A4C1Y0N4_EUMVA|nr:hypothetical protein EVAR_25361_1 [Eumeta japonica]
MQKAIVSNEGDTRMHVVGGRLHHEEALKNTLKMILLIVATACRLSPRPLTGFVSYLLMHVAVSTGGRAAPRAEREFYWASRKDVTSRDVRGRRRQTDESLLTMKL